jgi:hypothetical protein
MATCVLTEEEIERRKPVWIALSEFWLDTSLDDGDLRRIARVAAASRYSKDELNEIYLFEVAPVVSANLCSMAGEWAGFDEDWLCSKAKFQAETKPWFPRLMAKIGLANIHLTWPTGRQWRRMLQFLDSEP